MTENKNNTALKFAKAVVGVRTQELQRRSTLDLGSVFASRGVNLDNGLDNI